MSVSFGLKASTPKRRAAAPLAAFTAVEDDEHEAVLSEVEKLAESERLQVRSHLPYHIACYVILSCAGCAQHQLDTPVSGDRVRAMLLLMQRSILLHCKLGTKHSG